ncbi:putative phosphoglycerate mutase GpmB [Diplonema papillatum]|nr:putative phosphoglycerate mutase GpmB [Diplonema papillatum]|eukprot:gene15393-23536_t
MSKKGVSGGAGGEQGQGQCPKRKLLAAHGKGKSWRGAAAVDVARHRRINVLEWTTYMERDWEEACVTKSATVVTKEPKPDPHDAAWPPVDSFRSDAKSSAGGDDLTPCASVTLVPLDSCRSFTGSAGAGASETGGKPEDCLASRGSFNSDVSRPRTRSAGNPHSSSAASLLGGLIPQGPTLNPYQALRGKRPIGDQKEDWDVNEWVSVTPDGKELVRAFDACPGDIVWVAPVDEYRNAKGRVVEHDAEQKVTKVAFANGRRIWLPSACLRSASKRQGGHQRGRKTKVHFYLLRHAETSWNVIDRIQGQADTDLTEKGKLQAAALGDALAARGITFDALLISPLKRTCATADIAGLHRHVSDASSPLSSHSNTQTAHDSPPACPFGQHRNVTSTTSSDTFSKSSPPDGSANNSEVGSDREEAEEEEEEESLIFHDPRLMEIDVGSMEGRYFGERQVLSFMRGMAWDTKFPGGESRADLCERALQSMRDATFLGDSIAVMTHGGVIKALTRSFASPASVRKGVAHNCSLTHVVHDPAEDSWEVVSQDDLLPEELV